MSSSMNELPRGTVRLFETSPFCYYPPAVQDTPEGKRSPGCIPKGEVFFTPSDRAAAISAKQIMRSTTHSRSLMLTLRTVRAATRVSTPSKEPAVPSARVETWSPRLHSSTCNASNTSGWFAVIAACWVEVCC